MKLKVTILLLILIHLFGCTNPTQSTQSVELNPSETFTDEDAPLDFTHDTISFTGPWGYNRPQNSSRLYPLVVAGYWGEGVGKYRAVAQRYPAFVFSYQKDSVSAGESLALWIASAINAGYRIDPDRIYLTGFSRGGSGSYPLAKGMYNQGRYFAAILRVAGQSKSDIGNDIAAKTAIWYHIGLEDTATRVEVARKALELTRGYACNAAVLQTTTTDTITGYQRSTVTFLRGERPMFVYSEYTGMGHTSSPCYTDPAVLPWMFEQVVE